MTEDTLNYPKMVERALRGVLREVLTAVAEGGLSDQHHLYITFRTTAPGVQLADRLRAQYPDDMTIVLQHKFWGLEISDPSFTVTLSFDGKSEKLVIPFDAVVAFVDPSVNFGLQYEVRKTADDDQADDGESTDAAAAAETSGVVTLDSFRKK